MKAALCGLFFLSGTAALLFETLWFRQAGLAFGNGVAASSIEAYARCRLGDAEDLEALRRAGAARSAAIREGVEWLERHCEEER